MPRNFSRPPFTSYDGKTDLVEHVSHYIQMMSLYSQNDGLMCKVFPSSLGPTTMRWFNGLRKGSIHNFEKLIQAFGARFISCSRVPQPINALLSIRMGSKETLQSYANRYWELYNEIGGGNEQVGVSTFRLGLLYKSELRDSLTIHPLENMHQLMRRIEEHKRLEDDRLQGKGKALASSQYNRNSRPERYQQKAKRERKVPSLNLAPRSEGVNVTFKEPVYKILERIKNKSYF